MIAARLHNAMPGQDGPLVFMLDPFIIVPEGEVKILGTAELSDWTLADPVAELLNGNIYVNLHTDLFPAGEIRGQVIPD